MTISGDDADPRNFKIHRKANGWPRWYQRWLEAWWIVTGQWSLHRAWQDGVFHGSAQEYRRIIINGGDGGYKLKRPRIVDAPVDGDNVHGVTIEGGGDAQ